jgi:glutathione synthase/RimK-type ligase-like ATP-grasp enzyme
MKLFTNRYNSTSMSGKAIKDGLRDLGLHSRLIRKVNSKYVHDAKTHLVINWGDGSCPNYPNMLNRPAGIALAVNKIKSFKVMEDNNVSTLPVMRTLKEATAYLENGRNKMVFCRTKITGTKGKGIVVARTVAELADCKLYTGGITDAKRIEYRIHVFNGEVLQCNEKRRRNGYKENPKFNEDIRNSSSGWVFCISNVNPSQATKYTAIAAVEAMGLDFGGVDIVQTSDGRAFVIEVNTACGIEGTTTTKYCEAIAAYAKAQEVNV